MSGYESKYGGVVNAPVWNSVRTNEVSFRGFPGVEIICGDCRVTLIHLDDKVSALTYNNCSPGKEALLREIIRNTKNGILIFPEDEKTKLGKIKVISQKDVSSLLGVNAWGILTQAGLTDGFLAGKLPQLEEACG